MGIIVKVRIIIDIEVNQITFIYRKNYTQLRNISYITHSNRPDCAVQLPEHWANIPKVVGSIIELQVNWNDNSGGEIEASVIQFF